MQSLPPSPLAASDTRHLFPVIPKVVGKVKVIKVYDDNAIVRVVKDNKKEPVTLKDIVVKHTGITGK